MKKEIVSKYWICLDSSDNEIKKHTNYAEMIIHLFQLHSEKPKADYFVKWHKEYPFAEIHKGTYELEILGKYQNKYAKHFSVV